MEDGVCIDIVGEVKYSMVVYVCVFKVDISVFVFVNDDL